MFYTYILESLARPGQRYIGRTSDLRRRLAEHNAGKCRHTARYAPWKLKVYVAFEDPILAAYFERYLKSGSGHAFAQRHLLGAVTLRSK